MSAPGPATAAQPGDRVEYSDMANPPRVWEVTALSADTGSSDFALLDPTTWETCHSDLRQYGWRIVQRGALA